MLNLLNNQWCDDELVHGPSVDQRMHQWIPCFHFDAIMNPSINPNSTMNGFVTACGAVVHVGFSIHQSKRCRCVPGGAAKCQGLTTCGVLGIKVGIIVKQSLNRLYIAVFCSPMQWRLFCFILLMIDLGPGRTKLFKTMSLLLRLLSFSVCTTSTQLQGQLW